VYDEAYKWLQKKVKKFNNIKCSRRCSDMYNL